MKDQNLADHLIELQKTMPADEFEELLGKVFEAGAPSVNSTSKHSSEKPRKKPEEKDDLRWLWILFGSVCLSIWLYFDRSQLTTVDNPVLRCILAPLGGLALILLALYYDFLWILTVRMLVVVVRFVWMLLGWLVRFIFILSLLAIVLAGVGLITGWISLPVSQIWSGVAAVVLGTVAGMIIILAAMSQNNSGPIRVVAVVVAVALTAWIAPLMTVDLAMRERIAFTIISLVLAIRATQLPRHPAAQPTS